MRFVTGYKFYILASYSCIPWVTNFIYRIVGIFRGGGGGGGKIFVSARICSDSW